MFDNVGSKIQTWAIIFAIIDFIPFVVVAFIFWGMGGETEALIGTIVFIGGLIFAPLGSMLLYGYGSHIEETEDIHSTMQRANRSTAELLKEQNALLRQLVEQLGGDVRLDEEKPQEEMADVSGASNTVSDGQVVCSNCGAVQPEDRTECWLCKKPL